MMISFKSLRQIKNITLISVCAALMLALQVAMASLPNIETVTLLVMLYAHCLGKRTFYIIYLFVLAEGLIFGFGLWWIGYLYVWSILCLVVLLLGEMNSSLAWALVSAVFGLLFGPLCAIPYFFTRGIAGALAWIAAGFYFDLVHGVANFAIALLLWKPLSLALNKVKIQFGF